MSINAASGTDGTNNTPPPGGTPEPGYQNGTDGWYTSGTTASENTDGDTRSGGTGGTVASGGTNLSCSLTSEPTGNAIYHVHAFIGILLNKGTALPQNWTYSGAAFAVPDAVGMNNPNDPGGALGGQIVNPNSGGCFYVIHFHSESGMVHFEDPTLGQITGTGPGTAKYSLQNVLDVWGMSLSAIGSAIGASGSPTIIFGVPTAQISGSGCTHPCDEVVTYTAVTNPSQVMLSRHSAVWLIWGGIPSGGPPPVVFRIEN
jgi:hypothetical protein